MKLTFELAGDITIVKIQGTNITFANSDTNFMQFVPIKLLRLSKDGIIKEHPDLKDLPYNEMRDEAIKRFNEYVKKLEGEETIKDYVAKELEKFGWKLISIQKEGWRVKKIK